MANRDLVALRIDVGIIPETGHAKYPNFNLISSETRKGMDWSKYVDVHGSSVHYDKTSGHKAESIDSPYGHQICAICVPQDFVTEALLLFPDTVTAITPTEFETFYDNKAHAQEPDERVETNTLNGLNSQRQLMIATEKTPADTANIAALDVKIAKALDPNDKNEPGVIKNDNKKWADAKINKGINLKSHVPV